MTDTTEHTSACSLCGNGITPAKPWHIWCTECTTSCFKHLPVGLMVAAVLGLLAMLAYGGIPAVLGVVTAAAYGGFTLKAVAAGGLVAALTILALIDYNTQYLPDDGTLPLMWLGLLVNLTGAFTPLHSAVLGAVAGYLSLWAMFWAAKLATGEDAMGYGDFKLLAALGAWLGWFQLTWVFLGAGVLAGLFVVACKLARRDMPQMPFGPYIAVSGILVVFAGALR